MVDASAVLRQGLLQLSRSGQVRNLIETAPVSRDVVRRFVAGGAPRTPCGAATALVETGRLGTIDHLGEDTIDLDQARATRDAYLELLGALAEAGLTRAAAPRSA